MIDDMVANASKVFVKAEPEQQAILFSWVLVQAISTGKDWEYMVIFRV